MHAHLDAGRDPLDDPAVQEALLADPAALQQVVELRAVLAWAAAVPREETEAFLAALAKTEGVEYMSAPRVLVRMRESASMRVGEEVSYVKDFELERTAHGVIADPVVGTVWDGLAFSVVGTTLLNGQLGLQVEAVAADLTRPIPTFVTTLGVGAPVTIQLPRFGSHACARPSSCRATTSCSSAWPRRPRSRWSWWCACARPSRSAARGSSAFPEPGFLGLLLPPGPSSGPSGPWSKRHSKTTAAALLFSTPRRRASLAWKLDTARTQIARTPRAAAGSNAHRKRTVYGSASQALTDFFTLHEKWGSVKRRTLYYIGDGNNTCNSMVDAAAKLGYKVTVCAPENYEPHTAVIDQTRLFARESGAAVEVVNVPGEGIEHADAVYTDVWA